MRIRVKKWGNSLAVRIPRAFARETAVEEGSELEMKLEEGCLVLTPVLGENGEYELESLLEGVTPENLHAEVHSGEPRGREVW